MKPPQWSGLARGQSSEWLKPARFILSRPTRDCSVSVFRHCWKWRSRKRLERKRPACMEWSRRVEEQARTLALQSKAAANALPKGRSNQMRVTTCLSAVIIVITGALAPAGAGRGAAADGNSVVFKTSIQVSTAQVRSIRHADGMWYDDYWHWAPRIKFNVQGPLPGGSQLSTEFFLPGEKSWVKYDCRTPDVTQGQIGKIECGFGLSERELKGIKDTGDFSFKIQIKNELAGTNATLFSGHFNVKKFNAEPDLPVNKNHWLYYVDHDWELPLGMVWYPRPYRSADGVEYYNDYATLSAAFWFKSGDIREGNAAGYLFYQGKEISNTKSHGHVVGEIATAAGGGTG